MCAGTERRAQLLVPAAATGALRRAAHADRAVDGGARSGGGRGVARGVHRGALRRRLVARARQGAQHAAIPARYEPPAPLDVVRLVSLHLSHLSAH